MKELDSNKEGSILMLIQDELKIISVNELMNINLKIPDYQRPYRWSSSSTNTLFADTYEAYKLGIDEYRLGSVWKFYNEVSHLALLKKNCFAIFE